MIKIEDLRKTYDRRTKNAAKVLHGINLELGERGFVCILGPSGCGKTTLLNSVGGLDDFDSGKITVDETEITASAKSKMEKKRNETFSYIFQNYYLLADHTVAYNVYLGLHSLDISHKDKLKRVKEALKNVDMLRYSKRLVSELSGGQAQRVAIARAIARRPKVIFADEPTGNLDDDNTVKICEKLRELSRDSLVVMVTHEERIAKFFADRIIRIEDGAVVSDMEDWDRENMDAGSRDSIYTDDYSRSFLGGGNVEIELLEKENSAPIKLTVVVENDKVVLKLSDKRLVLSSEEGVAPFIVEGARPKLSHAKSGEPDKAETSKAAESEGKSGLGFGMLMKEALSLVSPKKLRKFATGVFVILLSLMISLSAADYVTASRINKEDFVKNDSHILNFVFSASKDLVGNGYINPNGHLNQYIRYLDDSGLELEYLPEVITEFYYKETTFPQLDESYINIRDFSFIPISHVSEDQLIRGRMPERMDEIVVDRLVLERMLEGDGILQNMIPNFEYFLDKNIYTDKCKYTPKIVGISDSGEYSIYIEKNVFSVIGKYGAELMSLSDYRELVGDAAAVQSLGQGECIVVSENAGGDYAYPIGTKTAFGMYGERLFSTVVARDDSTHSDVFAKFILCDEDMDRFYDLMIRGSDEFRIYTEDKEAVLNYLENTAEKTSYMWVIAEVYDYYTEAYEKHAAATAVKLDAKLIVTLSVILLSVIMIYLMQRSKIRERMDLITVYRLLGIPKRNLMFVFGVESIVLTLKYAVPTVLAVWLGILGLSYVDIIDTVLVFPFTAALVSMALILLIRLIIAVVPVFFISLKSPARLASKYDF